MLIYGKQSLRRAIRPKPENPSRLVRGIPISEPLKFSGYRYHSHSRIAVLGRDEAVVLNPAGNAIRTDFTQRLDPYHAHSTQDWPVSGIGTMHRNAKSAFPDFSWHERGVGQTVKPVTAQIMSHSFHMIGRIGAGEADRPVDLNSGASTTIPSYGPRLIDRTRV